jgi:UDP-arabinose 4-epimerase
MRVLVTGGSGYVGSHAVRELARRGYEVVIYDNLSTGHVALSGDFKLVIGDIADREKLRSCLHGVDIVMHFAASACVGQSILEPRKYFANNIESALKLMDCLLECSVKKFVFSSTCAVYGIPPQLPIVEESAKEPINPYGATKLFFERVLAAYATSHNLDYVVLRYFNAAGAELDGSIGECHDPETHIIPLALRAALRTGPPIRLFGGSLPTEDGTAVRDFIHVADLARAHVSAADYLANGGKPVTLNLGTGRGTSLKQLLAMIQRITGCSIPYTIEEARPGDPPTLYADASKARQLFGWQAWHGLEEIVRTAHRWEEMREKILERCSDAKPRRQLVPFVNPLAQNAARKARPIRMTRRSRV